jgi:hypothetical protein
VSTPLNGGSPAKGRAAAARAWGPTVDGVREKEEERG